MQPCADVVNYIMLSIQSIGQYLKEMKKNWEKYDVTV